MALTGDGTGIELSSEILMKVQCRGGAANYVAVVQGGVLVQQ